jgi:hypothetical protein
MADWWDAYEGESGDAGNWWADYESEPKVTVRLPKARPVSADGEKKAAELRRQNRAKSLGDRMERSAFRDKRGWKDGEVRSPWQRFKDGLSEGSLHSPIGAEGAARYIFRPMLRPDMSQEEMSRQERVQSDEYARKREEDETAFKDVDTFSPANIGKHAADLISNIIGGTDLTYVFAPGKTVAQRVLAQGGINASVDAGSQGIEIMRGVRDEYDPAQTALNAAAGVAFQGVSEGVSHARLGRKIKKGSAHPDFDQLVDITIHSESRGDDNAVSPKGARGKCKSCRGLLAIRASVFGSQTEARQTMLV